VHKQVNPEHTIWFKKACDNEAPSVDGLKADVRGELQHGWLLRLIVAADKYDCPLAVEGRISHDVESGLIEGFEDLGALGPFGHLLRARSRVSEGQAREVRLERVGAVHHHLAREVAGGLDGALVAGHGVASTITSPAAAASATDPARAFDPIVVKGSLVPASPGRGTPKNTS
jgi:hypothetical protein